MSDGAWEVVGGTAKGGILVRTGEEKKSPEHSERLRTGSEIRVVETSGSRVRYELLSGEGPPTGWVTIAFQGRDLIVEMKTDKVPSSQEALRHYCRQFGEQPQKANMGYNRKSFFWHGNAGAGGDVGGAQAELAEEIGLQHRALGKKGALLAPAAQSPNRFQLRGWALDADGDDVRICLHCNLPIGDFSYLHGTGYVHGECKAQLMVQDLRSEEKARVQRERATKAHQHSAYEIGWLPEHIPRNGEAASALALRDVAQGMVCLVFDESSDSILVASAMNSSAAMNLEYLSTALQVRRSEGHEPVFSLDPLSPEETNSMQRKVFEPEWLAGTAAGEVLFQSDYHLKELSMGEYEQPAVGMKSCFDFLEIEGIHGWSAREWFLVRKAEVLISDENILIPMVKMGVEAREQVVSGGRVEDKALSRVDHPMVKYAEEFTQNFDLIAERKSVFFHLRELAKASVMAKYLLDSGIQLAELWFNLGAGKEISCSLEVPQLWNERVHSQVCIEDGAIQDGQAFHTHGVYGGVKFGLEKFALAPSTKQPAAGIQALAFGLTRKPTTIGAAPSIVSLASGMQFAPQSLSLSGSALSPARLGAALSAASLGAPRLSALAAGVSALPAAPRALSGGVFAPPPRLQGAVPVAIPVPGPPRLLYKPGMTPVSNIMSLASGSAQFALPSAAMTGAPRLPDATMARSGHLQGVDLCLDQFDLSGAKRVSLEVQAGSWGGQAQSLDKCVALGSAFFACLDGSTDLFEPDDKALLQKVFNSVLSDRRGDGDLFVPPDASYSHVQTLRALVKKEDEVCSHRKHLFFSPSFSMGNPGNLFPHSWIPSFDISHGREHILDERLQGSLVARPEYMGQAIALLEHLQDSAPVFDKTTEEGLRFRIYTLGSLEVRTTQEIKCEEKVGVVFSVRNQTPTSDSSKAEMVAEEEKIAKVNEYVERVFVPGSDTNSPSCRYYLVLETEKGNKIVAERLSDGQLVLDVMEDVQDRNSLARLTRSERCTGTTVFDMMSGLAQMAEGTALSSKHFAEAMFKAAAGARRAPCRAINLMRPGCFSP